MRTLLLAIACCCVASAPVAAQQVWKVHNGSLPGAHFTDLPPAVAAAAPNDVILVYHGGTTGATYTAATIDKPLTIVGFSVSVQGPSGSEPLGAGFYGLFTITGIPAGQRVILSNCHVFQDTSVYPTTPTGIHVANCAGEVVLESFWFWTHGFMNSLLRFENSANVVLRGCDFFLGGSPIDIVNSTMLVTTTGVGHGNPHGYPNPPFPGTPIFTQTAEGMRVTNSNVTIVNSFVRGSQQINGYGAGYSARKGVHIVSGTVTAGPGAQVIGGAFIGGGATYAYSVVDPLTGRLRKDARAGVPLPWPPAPPIPITLHTMLHAWPIAGDIALFDIWGPPGGFALVAFGDRLTSPLPTPFGDMWFDPAASFAVDLVALTAPDGAYAWVRQLPLTAPVGYPFVLQALTLAPSGELSLTVPSPFTVAYPYWIAP